MNGLSLISVVVVYVGYVNFGYSDTANAMARKPVMVDQTAKPTREPPSDGKVRQMKDLPKGCWQSNVMAKDSAIKGSAIRNMQLKVVFSATSEVASAVFLTSKSKPEVEASSDFFCDTSVEGECQLANDHGRFKFAQPNATGLPIEPLGQWSVDRSLEEDNPAVAVIAKENHQGVPIELVPCKP